MIDEKKLIEDVKKYFKDLLMGCIIDSDTLWLSKEVCNIIESQPKVGEWIPVSDRLPEVEWGCETKALMYQLKTGSIEIGYYGEGGRLRDRYFRTYRDSCEGVDASYVLAWRPRPEPYKEE